MSSSPNPKRYVMTYADVRRGLARQYVLEQTGSISPDGTRREWEARFGEIPYIKRQRLWLSDDEARHWIGRKKSQGYRLVDFSKVAVEEEPDREEYNVPKPIRKLFETILGSSQASAARHLTENIELISLQSTIDAEEVLKQIGAMQPFAPGRIDLIQEYYTLLPVRRNPAHKTLMAIEAAFDVNEQAMRVNQYKALIGNVRNNLAEDIVGASYRALATELRWIDPLTDEWDKIARHVKTSTVELSDCFAVKIHDERDRYSKEALANMGKKVMRLYHGTKTPYVHSILKEGLKILPAAAHGSRLGRGLYFAEDARRSLGYVTPPDNFMFLCDVIVGKEHEDPGDHMYTEPPAGCDSVLGTMSWSGYDERVVYKEERATIRYLISVKRS